MFVPPGLRPALRRYRLLIDHLTLTSYSQLMVIALGKLAVLPGMSCTAQKSLWQLMKHAEACVCVLRANCSAAVLAAALGASASASSARGATSHRSLAGEKGSCSGEGDMGRRSVGPDWEEGQAETESQSAGAVASKVHEREMRNQGSASGLGTDWISERAQRRSWPLDIYDACCVLRVPRCLVRTMGRGTNEGAPPLSLVGWTNGAHTTKGADPALVCVEQTSFA